MDLTTDKRLEAIKLVKLHTSLPYSLSLHNCKSIENLTVYLKRAHSWVFDILELDEINQIFIDTTRNLID
tara:strand:+ start:746 stop:955 length:210 start_codon:yes stop_codon:yes gene_type:complete